MSEQPKTHMEKFRQFVDMVKGRKNVKQRVAVLANPDNLKTMSILKRNQAEFIIDAYWLGDTWGFFAPLRMYANEMLETNMSIEGKRAEQVIAFMQAFNEGKILSKLEDRVSGGDKGKR